MSLARRPQTVTLKPSAEDPTFDGIGVVDGGGATSVLLKDYPEPQRAQILDLLYCPKFGASVSTLLVEIPGDGNSTQGSMPSHQHTREDFGSHRGYMWWVLAEAKRRNPDLRLDAVAWSAPGWVGDGEFWSQDTADYYVTWLRNLRDAFGLELDAIGCRNEKGTSLEFAKLLRATLDHEGFAQVRIHAFDDWPADKFDFVEELRLDEAARKAIDIIGVHVLYERAVEQTPADVLRWARENGKPVWNTEDHVYRQGFECLIGIVECLNESFLLSGATKTVIWHGVAGVYPLEPYSEEPAALLAHEPWSGHYSVRAALWGYAHYGQFTSAGWRYLTEACTVLDEGGTLVALRSDSGEVSVVIETSGAAGNQSVRIVLEPNVEHTPLCVWRSDRSEQFMRMDDLLPVDGAVVLQLAPDAVYSVSTTTGQRKGAFADVPESQPFPFPYRDELSGYSDPASHGGLPQYTADISGAFELVDAPGGVPAIRQVVPVPTISWAPDWQPYTIIGDESWSDYEVSVRILLEDGDLGGLMARIDHVGTGYGFVPQCYYAELRGDGRCRIVEVNGKVDKSELVGDAEQQAFISSSSLSEPGGERVLAESRTHAVAGAWHELSLRVEADVVSVHVDDRLVVKARDALHARGMAGLIAGVREDGLLSRPYFTDLRIGPVGGPVPPPTPIRRAPLYRTARA